MTPIIQSIDSYETNHKLGIMFEARVGKGRLMVANIDTDKDTDRRPATQQLMRSLCQYMKSDSFKPKATLRTYELDALFDTTAGTKSSKLSDAATRQLLNK